MAFFDRLRQSSYANRRRWLFLLSITSGAVMLGIWVLYLGAAVDLGGSTALVSEGEHGFFQSFTAGVRDATIKIKGTSKQAYDQLKDALETANEIEVSNNESLQINE